MKIRQIFIFCLGLLILMVQTSCRLTRQSAPKKTVLSGSVKNYDKNTFSFTYDTYALLKGTQKKEIPIDSLGHFHIVLEEEGPLKGTLDFGRDLIEGRGFNKYIFTYLEPGDSIHISADVAILTDTNIIAKTLRYTGTSVENNEFIHHADLRFESYQQLRENNHFFIMSQQPEQYGRTVDSIRDLKIQFLNDYPKKTHLSPRLKEIFKAEAYNIAVVRKFNYPSQNASFNNGDKPVLPEGYYDFADKVTISSNLDKEGVPYLRFTHFFLNHKYQLAREDGFEGDYLSFIHQELKGRQKYIYMAYSLSYDFDADIYNQFEKNCPYRDIAHIVKTKFGHLESMLPGKPSPDIVLNSVKGENISALKFYKNKVTYIDLWATWCKPCIREFPDLAKLKEEYKDQNIQFVSISFDDKREPWIKYVEREGLTGAHFWADPENKKIYNKGFNIKMIPRFVLLDEEGRIINANAPRPSSGEEIRKLLNKSLKIN